MAEKKRNFSPKAGIILQASLIIGILVFVNLIGSSFFSRIDLTEDERFTVSDASVELLGTLPDEAQVNVYYAGDMPTYYKYLQENMRTLLSELQQASRGNFSFSFEDPSGKPDLFDSFDKMGWSPFLIHDPVNPTEVKSQYVLPYAKITYGSKSRYVNLVHGCYSPDGRDFDVYKATQNVEYNVMSVLYNLSREKTKTLAILGGHLKPGLPPVSEIEYWKRRMGPLAAELDEFYNMIVADIRDGQPIPNDKVDVLWVLQPETGLSEREKYEIDQYLMRGGRAIFTLDNEVTDFTIGGQASTLTSLRTTNLDDLFGKWSIKVNYDFVQDLNCRLYPAGAQTGTFGTAITPKPWIFYPAITDFPPHPVTRNLGECGIFYGSSIDTFFSAEIHKHVLMQSSPFSRRVDGVQYINVDQIINQRVDQRDFNKGPVIMGVLLNGKFSSAFVNRRVPSDSLTTKQSNPDFAPRNYDTLAPKIAVISDGEFALRDEFQERLKIRPIDNRQFMLNLVDYMSGQDIISKIRNRSANQRILNQDIVKQSRNAIIFLNLVVPVLAIIVFGGVRAFLRARRNKKLSVHG